MRKETRSIATRLAACLLCLPAAAPAAPAGAGERVDVRFESDEAEAALAILDLRARDEPVSAAAWERLHESEGYVRLKRREAAMNREFTDAEFDAFLSGAETAGRAPELRTTLERWRGADLSAAADRALAYLPARAEIRAKIYPSIKPKTNSFVFELDSDPAIFLYLDPAVSAAQLENTVAHELHHVGFGTACPEPAVEAEIEALPEPLRRVLRWTGAFGEGLAMLAAAGGPDAHPHASSAPEDRARWDADVARFAEDAHRVDAFFVALLDGALDEAQELETARSFYGIQGPWYTVGWRMAEVIERALGREELIGAWCYPRRLLPTYARAVESGRVAGAVNPWSARLLGALERLLPAPVPRVRL